MQAFSKEMNTLDTDLLCPDKEEALPHVCLATLKCNPINQQRTPPL